MAGFDPVPDWLVYPVPCHQCNGAELFNASDGDAQSLVRSFEKRHPITHNLGVVDRKYLERVQGREEEGKDVEISKPEIMSAAETMMKLLANLHINLAPIDGAPALSTGSGL